MCAARCAPSSARCAAQLRRDLRVSEAAGGVEARRDKSICVALVRAAEGPGRAGSGAGLPWAPRTWRGMGPGPRGAVAAVRERERERKKGIQNLELQCRPRRSVEVLRSTRPVRAVDGRPDVASHHHPTRTGFPGHDSRPGLPTHRMVMRSPAPLPPSRLLTEVDVLEELIRSPVHEHVLRFGSRREGRSTSASAPSCGSAIPQSPRSARRRNRGRSER